jgi:flagellar M-ring protein FliF
MWKGFMALPPSKRVTIALVSVITMVAIVSVVYYTNQIDYQVLFSNLSTEDAGNIVSRLQEKKVPYRVSQSGNAISVPSDRVSELRLELAASGLPQGGGVGFEIFDTKNLGLTEFVQQLNYQRALQGELARTINGLDEIQHCRVHVAIPKKTIFVEEQKKPTASVILKLKPGRVLKPNQIEGIAHLVSSSIEGLNPNDVMIVDSSGKVLSRAQDETRIGKLSNSQMEYQRNVEREITNRVQTMLEKVVGEGKAVVRASADLDFRITERLEEKYDPNDPVIRSVQRQTEKSDESDSKADETINYEISRTVDKTVMPVGDIRKLSIAVLVDGIYTKNEKGEETFTPRSKKEMSEIEELVRKAAGIDPKRDDQVIVSNVPLKRVDPESDAAQSESIKEKIVVFAPALRWVFVIIVAVCFFLFILRPLMKMLLERGSERAVTATTTATAASEKWPIGPTGLAGGAAVGELAEGIQPAMISNEPRMLTETDLIKQMANADSKRFAELLRNWMR